MTPIIHCQGFELTEAIAQAVRERGDKIQRRLDGLSFSADLKQETANRFRVHLEYTSCHDGSFNATAEGEDVYGLVREASDKLLRQINTVRDRQAGKHDRQRIGNENLPTPADSEEAVMA